MNILKSLVSKNSQSTKVPFGSGNRGRATTKTNTPPRPNMGPNTITKTNPSKSPALSNMNFPPQSSKTDSKDFQASHIPSSETPKNHFSPSSIMNIAVIPDEFGQPEEVLILGTKEQIESAKKVNKLAFIEDFDEDLQKLMREGKCNFVVLSSEEKEKVTKTFLEKVESPKQSSSNNNSVTSNVKITEEDVEYQEGCISDSIDVIRQIKNMECTDYDKRMKITVGYKINIDPTNSVAAEGLYKLVADELLYSKDSNTLSLRKFLTQLEGIEENKINTSIFLKNICYRIIKHIESEYPESLRDLYLWERKLSLNDINSYI